MLQPRTVKIKLYQSSQTLWGKNLRLLPNFCFLSTTAARGTAQQRKAEARLSLAGEIPAQSIHNQSHHSRQARRLDRFSKSTGLRRNLISHGLSPSALSSLSIPL